MKLSAGRGTPSNDDDPLRAKLRTLHAWLAKAVREKNVAVPDDTVGVLELYLDAGEATARRVMLVESHTGPAVTGLLSFAVSREHRVGVHHAHSASLYHMCIRRFDHVL